MTVTRTEQVVSEAFWYDGANWKELENWLIASEDGHLRHIWFQWRFDRGTGQPVLQIADQSKVNPPCQLCLQPRGWLEPPAGSWIVVTRGEVTWGGIEWFEEAFRKESPVSA